ncbi:MAG: GNAT family N-acetyltransferase [Bacteroidetes bacterium]|jgi:arginine-tRNA-protein transferase|nr:GNAT family N-acetyltransferase [Bacteroidota bacterium]
MFAEKHYPEMMIPEELDAYLAKGWYRMGQTIFTTHFLCFGRSFYSAIWVRLPLTGYRFRKSLRKIFNRNRRHFEVTTGAASINAEKERLYRRYKSSFSGMLAPTLRDALLDGEDFNIYQTREVRVYDGDRLIALSYFDLGEHSVASITGIYDPDYDKYSLGFYTMLEEIHYAQEAGLLYYYPGYVVPGYPRFSYKLRIGEVEYYSLPHQAWRPYEELTSPQVPIQLMESKLGGMAQYLMHQGVAAELLYYPLFEANLFGFWQAPYFDYPMFLLCSQRKNKRKFLCVVYDPRSGQYELLVCALFDDLQLYFNHSYTASFDKRYNFVELLVVESSLRSSTEPQEIMELLKAGLGNQV